MFSPLYPVTFAVPTPRLHIDNISTALLSTVIDKPEIGSDFQLQTQQQHQYPTVVTIDLFPPSFVPSRACHLQLFTKSFLFFSSQSCCRLPPCLCNTWQLRHSLPSALDPNTPQRSTTEEAKSFGLWSPLNYRGGASRILFENEILSPALDIKKK